MFASSTEKFCIDQRSRQRVKYSQKGGWNSLEPIEKARKAVEVASDTQAEDIHLLDISKVSSFADYFVICNGGSGRQIDAICDEIDRVLSQDASPPHHKEGSASSGWVLLDFGDVVVHIFSPEQREYYQLDSLWKRASTVLRVL